MEVREGAWGGPDDVSAIPPLSPLTDNNDGETGRPCASDCPASMAGVDKALPAGPPVPAPGFSLPSIPSSACWSSGM